MGKGRRSIVRSLLRLLGLLALVIILFYNPLLLIPALLLAPLIAYILRRLFPYYEEAEEPGWRRPSTGAVVIAPSRMEKREFSFSRGMRMLRSVTSLGEAAKLSLSLARASASVRGRRRIQAQLFTLDYTIPRGRVRRVHLPATIRAAALSGEFPEIGFRSLRERLMEGRGKASIILVLDTSASMTYSVDAIVGALSAIRQEAVRHRDRVAVVISKGLDAAVLQHPTTNFNLVLGKVREVGLEGYTPLAMGMLKGLQIALSERRRGYYPALVIVSDGVVNVPLIDPLGRRLHEDARESVLRVARLIGRQRVFTIVFNTMHSESPSSYDHSSATRLMMRVAEITKGVYIGIPASRLGM